MHVGSRSAAHSPIVRGSRRARVFPTVVTGAADGLELGSAFQSAQVVITDAGEKTFTYQFARYADLLEEATFQFGALMIGQVTVDDMIVSLQEVTDMIREDDAIPKFPREQPGS